MESSQVHEDTEKKIKSHSAVTSTHTMKHMENVLDELGLKQYYREKLSLSRILEISKKSITDEPAKCKPDLPWYFLKKLMMFNVTCINVKCTSECESNSDDESGSTDTDLDNMTDSPNKNNSMNPLDIITTLFLCSDGFLRQEMALKLSMCQFSVPLLLPNCDTGQCTLMLWAMRDIVKKYRPQSLSQSKGFIEERIVLSELPMVSFVRLGECSLSKSEILNKLLSNDQQYHNTFVHHNMECGDSPRRISNGLTEITWYLPCGNTNIDIFSQPVAVANLRGDIASFETQYSFLCQTSAAVFVFFDHLDSGSETLINLPKSRNCKAQIFLVGNYESKRFSLDDVKKVATECSLMKNNIIIKTKEKNDADFVKDLRKKVRNMVERSEMKMKIEKMVDVAHELGIQVDEDSPECQTAKKKADTITAEIQDIHKYKEDQLPRQGKIWKTLTSLEKEEFRLQNVGSKNVEDYKSNLKKQKEELQKKQNSYEMSTAMTNFITGISSPGTERFYFLKWMRMNLDNVSRLKLSEFREKYKEKCKNSENKDEIKEIDRKISSSSLGTEHFFREIGQIYEASLALPETHKLRKQLQLLPRLCAELLLDGFPLELVDGDASNIPLRWLSDILSQLSDLVFLNINSESPNKDLVSEGLAFPNVNSMSPKEENVSSDKYSVYPNSKLLSPNNDLASLNKDLCPNYSASQKNESVSSASDSESPNKDSMSPNKDLLSPNNDLLSLKNNSVSQNNNPLCPSKDLVPKDNDSGCLKTDSVSPNEVSLSPHNNLTFSNSNSVFPTKYSVPPSNNSANENTCSVSQDKESVSPNNNSVSQNCNLACQNKDLVSPNKDSACQKKETVSPNRDLLSLNTNLVSPTKDLVSPTKDFVSSSQDLLSLNTVVLSPNKDSVCPNNDSITPTKDLVSQKEDLLSRVKDSVCPKKNFLSPNEDFVSSNNRSVSPNKDYLYPKDDSVSPSKDSVSPDKELLSLHKVILSPNQQFVSLNEDSMNPNKESLSAHKDLFSPKEDVGSPNQDFMSSNNNSLSPNKEVVVCTNKDSAFLNIDTVSPNKDSVDSNKDLVYPNKNTVSPNNNLITPNNDLVSQNDNIRSPKEDLVSPNKDSTFQGKASVSSINYVPTIKDSVSPNNNFVSPNKDSIFSNRDLASPNKDSVFQNIKILVVTVLGVQSTGKSTLLNTMFGVQFAVSSGRCTRGAFMLLIKINEDMKKVLNCDFMVIIDTEGLKSPELAQLDNSYEHDNELATLVVGLSDVTIVNIAMENSTEMKDILQIVVHAFLRMKEVGKKPKCQFVHQNVSDVSAHEKNFRDRKLLLEQLNEMTQAAAKMEKKEGNMSFTDVMEYSPDTGNWYIPGLWNGNPPMAPVNAGYSEAVYELKKNIIQLLRYCESSANDIMEFKEWVKSLWNAVKHENFIFSFRNSLVADAYMKLCAQFNEWEWEFTKVMDTWVRDAETKISNFSTIAANSETSDMREFLISLKSEASTMLSTWETKILDNVTQYFKQTEGHVYLVEGYKEEFSNSVKVLRREIENGVMYKLEVAANNRQGMIKIGNITNYRKEIEKAVCALIDECQKKKVQMTDAELDKEFEKMWIESVQNQSFCKQNISNVTARVLICLRKNLGKKGIRANQLLCEKTLQDCGKEPFKYTPERWWNRFKHEAKKVFTGQDQIMAAQHLTDSIIYTCSEFVNEEVKRKNDYHDTFIQEILCIIDEKLQNNKDVKINIEFEVSLKQHICGFAARVFQKMHKDFIEKNDPYRCLIKNKEKFHDDFKDVFHKRDQCQKKAEEFTNRCLKPAVEDFINRSLVPHIIDEMRKLDQFKTRMSLQYSILLDLLYMENFQDYLSYISSYEKYVKTWILKQIKEHFSNKSSIFEFEDQHLRSCIDSINSAINKSKTRESDDLKAFVEDICKELGDQLVISQDALGSFMILNNADKKQFADWLKTSVNDLQKILRNNFKESALEIKLQYLHVNPQNELFNQFSGCGKQCPFCKAPCEAGGGKGHTDHFASLHRPKGLGSCRWDGTKKLGTDICSSLVISDKSFCYSDTNNEWHPYKNYKDIFKDWHIQPDVSLEASDYWKYVMTKYNSDFAKEYQAETADIPETWHDINKDQAEQSVRESFSIK